MLLEAQTDRSSAGSVTAMNYRKTLRQKGDKSILRGGKNTTHSGFYSIAGSFIITCKLAIQEENMADIKNKKNKELHGSYTFHISSHKKIKNYGT